MQHNKLVLASATLILLLATALAAAVPGAADHPNPLTMQNGVCLVQDDGGSGGDATMWWDAPVVIGAGTTVGCVDELDGEDWYLYHADGNEAFRVTLTPGITGLPVPVCTGDYDLAVYNEILFPQAGSFEHGCTSDMVEVWVDSSGWYFVEVVHFEGGDYHLTIEEDVPWP